MNSDRARLQATAGGARVLPLQRLQGGNAMTLLLEWFILFLATTLTGIFAPLFAGMRPALTTLGGVLLLLALALGQPGAGAMQERRRPLWTATLALALVVTSAAWAQDWTTPSRVIAVASFATLAWRAGRR